jgi:hypothetical protein
VQGSKFKSQYRERERNGGKKLQKQSLKSGAINGDCNESHSGAEPKKFETACVRRADGKAMSLLSIRTRAQSR